MRKFFAVLLTLSFLLPLPAFAADQTDLLQKIEALSRELESLKTQMQDIKKAETVKEERITMVEKKAEESAETSSWLEIGGDYRFRFDHLKGTVHEYLQFTGFGESGPTAMYVPEHDVKNSSLMTNRFGLNLKAKATEDIQVKARLLMYKAWGNQGDAVGDMKYFGDRMGVFDGNIGHVPGGSALIVDTAYATWSNVADLPVWFSVGRRPSTGGIPGTLRQNQEKTGTAGAPSFLVDYAFDGMTLGVVPDIEALPGSFAKVCYGKGFDSGYKNSSNVDDVNMLGVNMVGYDTENLHAELQWNRAFDIFNGLSDSDTMPATDNLGNIDQYGLLVMGKLDDMGPGDLNLFAAGGISQTHPNDHLVYGMAGLNYDAGDKKSTTGSIVYLGARYDFKSSGTKIGLEYNHGTKNWIAFTPASDDMWTSKLGTRGNVYEGYLIQELNWLKPISKRGRAYVRLGYQYYDFQYTGSNNWIGAPKKISELMSSPYNMQMLPPVDKAHDIYFSFDVTF
ncbi:MAG: DUF3373 family protein [Nitrospirales bacterium]|nr:DUF3373 family protein [Nitrospirales bacterium]